MNQLAILGASGHGKVVADTAESLGWGAVIFFDDAWPILQHNGVWPVQGNTNTLMETLDMFSGVIVAIGDNQTRQEKMKELIELNAKLVTLVHPSATVSQYATIGPGSVVFAGAIVNAGTHVGLGAILNTACSVDHDCILGEFVHISPGARLAGSVTVGDLSWVGIGANVKQKINIGSKAIVGAGAAVVHHIEAGHTVVGVPAVRLIS